MTNGNFNVDMFEVGPLPTNCYLIRRNDSKEAVIIDPGPGAQGMAGFIKDKGYEVKAFLLTHGHADHADGLEALSKALSADESIPSYAAEPEKATLADPFKNVSIMVVSDRKAYSVTDFLKDGEELTLGGMKVRCIYTPGHTEGGCCFYFPDAMCCFVGDSVFAGSVGRTDFPGGSMKTLITSIREKIFTLPDTTVLYTGHGDTTTVGIEKRENPFLADMYDGSQDMI